jgi:hypothetical protein
MSITNLIYLELAWQWQRAPPILSQHLHTVAGLAIVLTEPPIHAIAFYCRQALRQTNGSVECPPFYVCIIEDRHLL